VIAPTYESLATKYAKPGKIAFCKINVDNQRDVSSAHGVSAMPTFMVFHNGKVINTIKGANPPALTSAVEQAVKLAGPGGPPGAVFGTPGRTLGGPGVGPRAAGGSVARPLRWDLNNLINVIIVFFGLYFVSLFSVRSSHHPSQPHSVETAWRRQATGLIYLYRE
jgi:thioredoxin 1